MYLTPAERRFTGSEIDALSGPVLHRRHEQRAWEAQWFDRERADETPVRNVVAVEMRSEQGHANAMDCREPPLGIDASEMAIQSTGVLPLATGRSALQKGSAASPVEQGALDAVRQAKIHGVPFRAFHLHVGRDLFVLAPSVLASPQRGAPLPALRAPM